MQIITKRAHTARQQKVVSNKWRCYKWTGLLWVDYCYRQLYTVGRTWTITRTPTLHGITLS
eukprot:2045238-Ditylum_brightwellii.AAC.1